MQRRTLLTTAATVAGGLGLGVTAGARETDARSSPRPMRFYSPASQLDANGEPLLDDAIVAVWAEPTAYNVGSTRGNAVDYGDDPIPLVSIDGSVAGFGAMMVPDSGRIDASANFAYGNDRAVLEVWDALIDGDTVLWDGSHGQYWDLGKFGRFAERAAGAGYSVRATGTIDERALAAADGLVVPTPPRAFTAAERDALASFVADGGALLLHDQATFRGLDETDNLNAIAQRLDLSFRFNADEVNDDANNGGAPFEVLTTRYAPPLGGSA